ncbi:MAG: hypothetical protein AAFN10_20010 [Bacteroidota bacterium]
MKRILLSICLLGLFFSLTAQDKVLRNSLSLNFASSFRNLGVITPIEPPSRFVFPGLEYRYDYGERLSLRAGLDYLPLLSYELRDAGSTSFVRNSARGLHLTSGIQYRFWGDDFSKHFRAYALADLVLGRQWVERVGSFDTFTTLVEEHTEWLVVHASLAWGLGVEYLPIDRLVIRAEFALSVGLNRNQLIDRLEDDTTEFGFFPQAEQTPFLINTSPFTELSIGWRF